MKSFHTFITESFNLNTGYHVAPAAKHSAINKVGLATKGGTVYVWRDIANAKWFARLHADDGKKMDIWKVDLRGKVLVKDPETDDMSDWGSAFKSGEDGHGYIHRGKVEADRLQYMYSIE